MDLRQAASDSDRDQTYEIMRRAFNAPTDGRERWDARTPNDMLWGLYDGDVLLASARVIDWGQFFGGRSVRMAGISGVGVAPQARGRGHASELFRRLFPVLQTEGYAISGLYPATTGLYRGVGYEVAAHWSEVTVPTRALRSLPRASHVDVRVGTRDDLDAIIECERRVGAQRDGWIDISRRWWEHFLPGFDDFFWYIADDARGYVLYRQVDDPKWGFVPKVEGVITDDFDVFCALWHTIASSSSMAPSMTIRNVGPTDPLHLLLPEQDLQTSQELRYMLAIVDVGRAMTTRGFARGLTATADVEIDGERWRLLVEDGVGAAVVGGSGDVVLDRGAFASLWSGWATPALLRASGRLRGGDTSALGAMFAGPTPGVQLFF